MPSRFGKEHRLSLRSDFSAVFHKGARRQTPHFIVYRLRSSHTTPRLGIALSRTIGGAVKRNRLKRRIREWFRHRLSTFDESFDMVVRCRSGSPSLSYQEICKELDGVFRMPGEGCCD